MAWNHTVLSSPAQFLHEYVLALANPLKGSITVTTEYHDASWLDIVMPSKHVSTGDCLADDVPVEPCLYFDKFDAQALNLLKKDFFVCSELMNADWD